MGARCLWGFLLLALLAACPPLAMAAPRIENVRAEVEAGQALPPMVRERMEQSVAAIAAQLLVGQGTSLAGDALREKESVIHAVFDKILVGYTVRSVSIASGETAIVAVSLLPWDDRVQEIRVQVRIDGMPPEIEAMARRDLAGIEDVFREGLQGLPVAAADWTNGVLKRRLREYLEEHLPEFWGDFDVELQGTEASVSLALYPRLPVARSVDLRMRSDTLPNTAMVNHRETLQRQVERMVGVPVAFLRRHAGELAEGIARFLDGQKDFRALAMRTRAELDIGEQVRVTTRSDSDRYRIRLTGWADLGRRKNAEDDLLLRLHMGRKLSGADEVFLLMDVAPQDTRWTWALGYRRDLLPGAGLSLRYDMRHKHFVSEAEYRVHKDWLLRYEYRFGERTGEAGVRYRLHDFLGVEYVIDRHDNWLRLIGNF